MPDESHAMLQGHAQAVALVAATHAAIAAGDHLPWDQVDEIVRGDYAREALAAVASLVALSLNLVNDGVQVATPDFLDVLAGACAAEFVDEEA